MHEPTLKALGCYEEVKELLSNIGLFEYAFNPLPSYQSLIVEFLLSFVLRYEQQGYSCLYAPFTHPRTPPHQE